MTIRFDQASYRLALGQFVDRLHADSVLLLKEEMRLLLRDIMRFTPPNSLAQGRNAIKGDLFGGKKKSNTRGSSIGLFQRIGSSALAIPVRARHAGAATYAVRLGWEQSKVIRIYKQFWKPNASIFTMYAFYKRFQSKTTGRPGFISQSVIGRQKVQDQMWISNSAANAFFAHIASRVGYTKSGWIKAADRVGLSVGKWISRHRVYANGDYKEPTPDDLTVVATNRTSKIPNYFGRHVYPAVRSRVRSINSELSRLLAGGKSRRGSLVNTPSGQAD